MEKDNEKLPIDDEKLFVLKCDLGYKNDISGCDNASKLLEFVTRMWPFCSEMHNLIRCISSTKSSFGGQHVREFLRAIAFPAQLVCLLTRDGAPKTLRDRFAGSI